MFTNYVTPGYMRFGNIVCGKCGKYCESHNRKDQICLKCFVSVVPDDTIDEFLIENCLGKIGVLIYNEFGDLVYAIGRFEYEIDMFDLKYFYMYHLKGASVYFEKNKLGNIICKEK